MTITVTAAQIALVTTLIPSDGPLSADDGGYGWTEDYITSLMNGTLNGVVFSPTQAVRFFWLQRVNETSEYIDAGKPLTEIHKQAKEMLDYWDLTLKLGANALGPTGIQNRTPMTFGQIERFCE